MWAAPDVVRYIGGKPSTPSESWRRMLSYRGLWALLGFGYWRVREKVSGRYVGDLGFADFHRMMAPSISGVPEAGWALAPWAHGKGYATEALSTALAWLDGQGYGHSVCLIAPENLPSIRLAEKVGYGAPQRVQMNGEDTLLFRRAANTL